MMGIRWRRPKDGGSGGELLGAGRGFSDLRCAGASDLEPSEWSRNGSQLENISREWAGSLTRLASLLDKQVE